MTAARLAEPEHRDRGRAYAFASWIARQTFSPLAGSSTWRTPNGASASTTALCTAGVEPDRPRLADPLRAERVRRGRRLHRDRLPERQLGGGGERVARECVRQRVAVLVVDEVLVERLRDAGRDAAVHLALGDQRVDRSCRRRRRQRAAAARPAPSRCRPRRPPRARRTGRSGCAWNSCAAPSARRACRRPPPAPRARPRRAPRWRRAGDVEAAEALVEHDVVRARLEVVARRAASPARTTSSAASRAATPPICVDFEPYVPVPFAIVVGVALEDRDLSIGMPEPLGGDHARTSSRDPGRARTSRCGESRRRPGVISTSPNSVSAIGRS